jgi:outer membrane protein
VLSLNENNIVVAKENLDITLEKFKLNQVNSIEIRQAQSSYEDALFNAIAARYTAKISEIELKKISNILILENE